MRKTYLTFAASCFAFQAMARPAEQTARSFMDDPLLAVYITIAAMAVLLVLVVCVTVYAIRILNFLTREITPQAASKTVTSIPLARRWEKVFQKMNASVPLEKESDIEMHHSYDGIRELDNHLPPWWKWLFYGTIGWSVVYLIMFHVTTSLPLSVDEYKIELALAEDQLREYRSQQPRSVIDENTLEYNDDAATIERGKAIFSTNNCGGCHRSDGGGNSIGPNLADQYWLHGGATRNVFLTIRNGVVEKGMPAWGKSMSAEDVRDVTFFVLSLQGTNPPDGKAPQGEIFKQVSAGTDSVRTMQGL